MPCQTPASGRPEYAYLFTPSSTVHSNNLPYFDGDFHIVITKAIAANTAEAPTNYGALEDFMLTVFNFDFRPTPARYYKISKIWSPVYTVSFSAFGTTCSISEGVTGAVDSINAGPAEAPPPIDTPPSLPPTSSEGPNNPPSITGVTIQPAQVPASLPAGFDAVVSRRGQLVFTVRASDSDKDPLVISRASDNNGRFTDVPATGRTTTFDGTTVSGQIVWLPSKTANLGDEYTLTFTVRDPRGASANTTRRVKVLEPALYVSSAGPWAYTQKLESMGLQITTRTDIPSDMSQYSLVTVDDGCSNMNATSAGYLKNYVRRGGTVVLAGGVPWWMGVGNITEWSGISGYGNAFWDYCYSTVSNPLGMTLPPNSNLVYAGNGGAAYSAVPGAIVYSRFHNGLAAIVYYQYGEGSVMTTNFLMGYDYAGPGNAYPPKPEAEALFKRIIYSMMERQK